MYVHVTVRPLNIVFFPRISNILRLHSHQHGKWPVNKNDCTLRSQIRWVALLLAGDGLQWIGLTHNFDEHPVALTSLSAPMFQNCVTQALELSGATRQIKIRYEITDIFLVWYLYKTYKKELWRNWCSERMAKYWIPTELRWKISKNGDRVKGCWSGIELM